MGEPKEQSRWLVRGTVQTEPARGSPGYQCDRNKDTEKCDTGYWKGGQHTYKHKNATRAIQQLQMYEQTIVYKVPEIRNGGLKRPKVTDGDRARTLRTEVMALMAWKKRGKARIDKTKSMTRGSLVAAKERGITRNQERHNRYAVQTAQLLDHRRREHTEESWQGHKKHRSRKIRLEMPPPACRWGCLNWPDSAPGARGPACTTWQ